LVLDSGVERWKVTPSKSETTWSIDAGGALRRNGKLGAYVAVYTMQLWRGRVDGNARWEGNNTQRTVPLGGIGLKRFDSPREA
jgi:hypothetical protein